MMFFWKKAWGSRLTDILCWCLRQTLSKGFSYERGLMVKEACDRLFIDGERAWDSLSIDGVSYERGLKSCHSLLMLETVSFQKIFLWEGLETVSLLMIKGAWNSLFTDGERGLIQSLIDGERGLRQSLYWWWNRLEADSLLMVNEHSLSWWCFLWKSLGLRQSRYWWRFLWKGLEELSPFVDGVVEGLLLLDPVLLLPPLPHLPLHGVHDDV